MNIFVILFVLGVLGWFVIGTLAVFIAFFARQMKLAAWLTGITLGGVVVFVGGWVLLAWFTDPYVRHSVPPGDVIGNYQLNQNGAEAVQHMGYTEFDARIELKADGSFVASHIPACCVHGQDESAYPFSGGYYTLAGHWEIGTPYRSDVEQVQLTLSRADLQGQKPDLPTELVKERVAPGELSADLLKGKPLKLGFEVFNGDFDPIVFERVKGK